jgi:hypothetical protein
MCRTSSSRGSGSSSFPFNLTYQSVKFIEIKNWRLAVVNNFLKLAIIFYILFYQVYYKGGYQEIDLITGTVSPKIKGSAGSNNTVDRQGNPEYIAYDAVDLVQPPLEADGFFIMTQLFRKSNQTRGVCSDPNTSVKSGDINRITGLCNTGTYSQNGGLIVQQQPVNSSQPACTNCCLVAGWCTMEPLHYLKNQTRMLQNVENFSIYLKVNAFLNKFDIAFTNSVASGASLISGYNGFLLKNILSEIGKTVTEIQEPLSQMPGAIILGNIDYGCNLDYGAGKWQFPRQTFVISRRVLAFQKIFPFSTSAILMQTPTYFVL